MIWCHNGETPRCKWQWQWWAKAICLMNFKWDKHSKPTCINMCLSCFYPNAHATKNWCTKQFEHFQCRRVIPVCTYDWRWRVKNRQSFTIWIKMAWYIFVIVSKKIIMAGVILAGSWTLPEEAEWHYRMIRQVFFLFGWNFSYCFASLFVSCNCVARITKFHNLLRCYGKTNLVNFSCWLHKEKRP